jgi:hypothetical protein
VSDAIPVILVICLASMWVLVPATGPRRARRRSRDAALGLQSRYRFTPDPDPHPLAELSSLPPFHYGKQRQVSNAVKGSFAGLAGEVFGYSCRENGAQHWYEVAVVRLGRNLPPLEIQHEPVFTSARVHHTQTEDRQPTGVEDFDSAYRAWTPDDRLASELITPGFARTLLTAPEPCDWRVEAGLLVLWKRDGWQDSTALVDCCLTVVHALAPVLDLDPDRFDVPRSIPGPGQGPGER